MGMIESPGAIFINNLSVMRKKKRYLRGLFFCWVRTLQVLGKVPDPDPCYVVQSHHLLEQRIWECHRPFTSIRWGSNSVLSMKKLPRPKQAEHNPQQGVQNQKGWGFCCSWDRLHGCSWPLSPDLLLHRPPRRTSGCCPSRHPRGQWGAAWCAAPSPGASSTPQTAAPWL